MLTGTVLSRNSNICYRYILSSTWQRHSVCPATTLTEKRFRSQKVWQLRLAVVTQTTFFLERRHPVTWQKNADMLHAVTTAMPATIIKHDIKLQTFALFKPTTRSRTRAFFRCPVALSVYSATCRCGTCILPRVLFKNNNINTRIEQFLTYIFLEVFVSIA